MSTETKPSSGHGAAHPLQRVPAALGLVAVGLQIVYPLLSGVARDRVTVAVVVMFAATNVSHAAVSRGASCAAIMLAATAGFGFVVEQVGVHTGFPFGTYSYGSALGPRWAAVPPLVALAWTMLAWPAALAARIVIHGRWGRVVVGAWALAATDLFLDPQMVHARYWSWADRSPHLPGIATVPLSNFAGWLLVALLMSAMLQVLLDGWDRQMSSSTESDRLPTLLYIWLCLGWAVALGCFLDLPAAAGWGALATAPVVASLAFRVRKETA